MHDDLWITGRCRHSGKGAKMGTVVAFEVDMLRARMRPKAKARAQEAIVLDFVAASGQGVGDAGKSEKTGLPAKLEPEIAKTGGN
jgi:hypothetical protein